MRSDCIERVPKNVLFLSLLIAIDYRHHNPSSVARGSCHRSFPGAWDDGGPDVPSARRLLKTTRARSVVVFRESNRRGRGLAASEGSAPLAPPPEHAF